jgi:hypothetical protein
MNTATLPKVKLRVDGLVRCGKTGLPKFDAPHKTPVGVKKLLTLGDLQMMDEETVAALGLSIVLEIVNQELK